MAPFAAARRAPIVPPGHEPPRHAVRAVGHDLAARLRDVGVSAGSLEDALQSMLRAIVETTGAAAAALCLYDVREQALRLAAEIGLSDEGAQRLRHIARRGEGTSWGIPLHGMLNRRCYLIEHAARNRFVPPLIPDADRIETVACLPVYAGDAPLASLVLVTRAPRTLGERELHGIETPVHELGRSIELLNRRALERALKPPVPASARASGVGATGAVGTTSPGVETTFGPSVPSTLAADAASLAAEADRIEREHSHVAGELETLRSHARAQADADAAELARLRTQLGEAEAGAADERRARGELEVRLAAESSARGDELRRALEAARDAERAHEAARAEAAALRIALERERQSTAARASRTSSGHDRPAADRESSVGSPSHRDDAAHAALVEATAHVHDARAQAWNVAMRLVETEAALDASRGESQGQIASLTMHLGALRKELAVVRAMSVRAARTHARTLARQRVRDLRDVVRALEGCADAIDRLRLTGAEPLREAATRFADIASAITVDYGRAEP